MYHVYLKSIIFCKIILILLILAEVYLWIKGKKETELDKKLQYFKSKVENVFKILMSLLLVFLFNPRTDRSILIDYETKLLLCLFGIILLITMKQC
uniref:Uncharacterized protein n=1 Tax=viral metagenome TaxID=1070528 RepID=A0A6C0B8U4_9ZZZZ